MPYCTVYITANEEIPKVESVKSFPTEEDAYNHAVNMFMEHVNSSFEDEPGEREKYEAIVKTDQPRKLIFEELSKNEKYFFCKDVIRVLEIKLDESNELTTLREKHEVLQKVIDAVANGLRITERDLRDYSITSKNEKSSLQTENEKLREENEALQKKYLELQEKEMANRNYVSGMMKLADQKLVELSESILDMQGENLRKLDEQK